MSPLCALTATCAIILTGAAIEEPPNSPAAPGAYPGPVLLAPSARPAPVLEGFTAATRRESPGPTAPGPQYLIIPRTAKPVPDIEAVPVPTPPAVLTHPVLRPKDRVAFRNQHPLLRPDDHVSVIPVQPTYPSPLK